MATTVDMEVVHATPCVQVRLRGPKGEVTVRCHLDTGGGWTFVGAEAAARLGLEVSDVEQAASTCVIQLSDRIIEIDLVRA